jgi:hypothetical protein
VSRPLGGTALISRAPSISVRPTCPPPRFKARAIHTKEMEQDSFGFALSVGIIYLASTILATPRSPPPLSPHLSLPQPIPDNKVFA